MVDLFVHHSQALSSIPTSRGVGVWGDSGKERNQKIKKNSVLDFRGSSCFPDKSSGVKMLDGWSELASGDFRVLDRHSSSSGCDMYENWKCQRAEIGIRQRV